MVFRYLFNPFVIHSIYNNRIPGFAEGLLTVFAYICAILCALSFHELGHAFVAYKQGDNTAKYFGRLTLNPLKHLDFLGFAMLLLAGFGWAKPVPINHSNFKHLKRGIVFVSLAGVATNLIFAFFFCGIYGLLLLLASFPVIFEVAILYYVYYFLIALVYLFIFINLGLALFNIIPLFPLDGYRLLESRVRVESRGMVFIRQYSMPILIILIISNILNIYVSFFTKLLITLFNSFWGLFGLLGIGV